jgi:Tat protein secretion system quality control protein TatD with DNase activity
MDLSFWFEFVLRPESGNLLRNMPNDRFFLETDGADVDIRSIYQKVATDRSQNVDDLKSDILNNYKAFFEYKP